LYREVHVCGALAGIQLQRLNAPTGRGRLPSRLDDNANRRSPGWYAIERVDPRRVRHGARFACIERGIAVQITEHGPVGHRRVGGDPYARAGHIAEDAAAGGDGQGAHGEVDTGDVARAWRADRLVTAGGQ